MLVRNGQNPRLSTTSEAKQDLLQERKLCDSVRQRYHYGTTDPEEVAQSALFRSGWTSEYEVRSDGDRAQIC